MRTLDARYKLLLFLLGSITAFIAKDRLYGSGVFAGVCLITLAMGQVRTTLKHGVVYVCVLGAIYAAGWPPGVLASLVLWLCACSCRCCCTPRASPPPPP